MNRLNLLVGRGLQQLDYAAYQRIQDRVTPMLTDTAHVEKIIAYIKEKELYMADEYMTNLICVGCIYDIYCPGSFFASSIAKMQIGIRDEVARCMGYNNPELVNYYLEKSKPFMKFRNKEFGQNVEKVKEAFKHLSVRKQDWELNF